MNELLVWSLEQARRQTLNLVEDLHEEQIRLQSAAGENSPAWILGHLLLGDIYLLSLLKAQEISEDFSDLLSKYGPNSSSSIENYDSKQFLVERLTQTGFLRLDEVRKMKDEDFAQPMPDEILARTQPTIAHHLLMLIYHEGHHGGQLSSWRKAQRLSAVKGMFAS